MKFWTIVALVVKKVSPKDYNIYLNVIYHHSFTDAA